MTKLGAKRGKRSPLRPGTEDGWQRRGEVPRCRCRRRPREGAAGARCSARGAGGAGPRRAGAALVRGGGRLAVGAFNGEGDEKMAVWRASLHVSFPFFFPSSLLSSFSSSLLSSCFPSIRPLHVSTTSSLTCRFLPSFFHFSIPASFFPFLPLSFPSNSSSFPSSLPRFLLLLILPVCSTSVNGEKTQTVH